MDAFGRAVAALFAITNPLGVLPIFLGITGNLDATGRRRQARRAAATVFAILAVSALAGQWILQAFGISPPAFQAAGGLVIILMALEMLKGHPSPVQHDRSGVDDPADQIVVPFAMPMVAGPGAITTVITLSVTTKTYHLPLMALLASALVSASLWGLLLLASVRSNLISPRAQRILTRFMGLILCAVGFQIGLQGVKAFLL
ncbi:MAG: MarC family protein [Gammaproteobacteria bacterium]|nr:MarC family protein [Gammaproteobacteria bacterium]